MDLSNPLRAVAPGVESDVVAVLLRSHAPLTGARVAALAERSETQVRVVLRRLEQHGLVDAERHGQSYSYLLNREHMLMPGLEQIHQTMPTLEDRVGAVVQTWALAPASLILFGSAARRDGDADSDIDLLLVRHDTTNTDDETWAEQRHALAGDVERWTGNSVQIVDLSESELATAVRRREPLISGLRADGIVLAGRDPEL
jgi:predicted nucleotidyltransferase